MSIRLTIREAVRGAVAASVDEAVTLVLESDKMKDLVAQSLIATIESEIQAYVNDIVEEIPKDEPQVSSVSADDLEETLASLTGPVEAETPQEPAAWQKAQTAIEPAATATVETSGEDFLKSLQI